MSHTSSSRYLQIYQCEDRVDGILSAIYEAGLSDYGHDCIRIEPQVAGEENTYLLFSEYINIATDAEKAEKVVRTVRNKISERAYQYMMYALSSAAADRGDAVYQFLIYAFSNGDRTCDMLQLPAVKRVFELQRSVKKELHSFIEFLRFQEVQKSPSLMFAVFEPKNRILSGIMEHFHERFLGEHFLIFDQTHQEAGIHIPDLPIEYRILTEQEAELLRTLHEQEDGYPELWKTFFHSIAIEERKNTNLQRNLMPLHYRKHVTEFL